MRSGLDLALILALGTAVLFVQPAPAQERWAAIDPNSETSSPVVWGATEEEARERAIEACKRVSKTCANGPASTRDMRETFAVMCCTSRRRGAPRRQPSASATPSRICGRCSPMPAIRTAPCGTTCRQPAARSSDTLTICGAMHESCLSHAS
jgi:hypothetical protein